MFDELDEALFGFRDDPYGHVMFSYPWGEGELAGFDGPDVWQRELLEDLGRRLRGEVVDSYDGWLQYLVSSGHGVGKSCLISWLIRWFLDTRPFSACKVTANTREQLDTCTWRELAKWHRLAINSDRYDHLGRKYIRRGYDPALESRGKLRTAGEGVGKTWYAAAVTWSENRPQGLAGTHESEREDGSGGVAIFMDEASIIPESIWVVTDGVMTTEGAMRFAFGNPTENVGRFAESLEGRFRHRWLIYKVDSRNAKMADKDDIRRKIEDYGEDSDYVRVRIRGELPRASSRALLSVDVVDAMFGLKLPGVEYEWGPVVLGVDVARANGDQSVILARQGRRVLDIQKFRELDGHQLGARVAEIIRYREVRMTFVDANNVGASVVDYLFHSGYRDVLGVYMGGPPVDKKKFFNKRAECWVRMAEWAKTGSCDYDPELKEELLAMTYGFAGKGGDGDVIQLMRKEDVRVVLGRSPDVSDALAMTFYEEIFDESLDADYDNVTFGNAGANPVTGY